MTFLRDLTGSIINLDNITSMRLNSKQERLEVWEVNFVGGGESIIRLAEGSTLLDRIGPIVQHETVEYLQGAELDAALDRNGKPKLGVLCEKGSDRPVKYSGR